MRVLLVKTSSLGDLIHTFPALSDAVHTRPYIRFDWLVEEAFAEVIINDRNQVVVDDLQRVLAHGDDVAAAPQIGHVLA